MWFTSAKWNTPGAATNADCLRNERVLEESFFLHSSHKKGFGSNFIIVFRTEFKALDFLD